VVQGLTLPRVIRWLKISGNSDQSTREERKARLRANQAALDHLEQLASQQPGEALDQLRSEYQDRIRQLQAADRNAPEQVQDGSANWRLRQEALKVERRALLQLRAEHTVDEEVLSKIQHDLDMVEIQIDRPR
jgi:hypothetical protein